MVDAGQRHRLVAILAADAVGYSRLMAIDERATVAALDAAREVFRREASVHGGRIVDTAGDSVLAVFDAAAGAADTATAVQLRLAGLHADIGPDHRLAFRVGLHLGDVIEKADGTVYGNGVNIAARLQSLAAPGEIWLSEAMLGALGSGAGRSFNDQGRHTVKNIAELVHAFRLDPVHATESVPPARRQVRRIAVWAFAAIVICGLATAALLSSSVWRGAVATDRGPALRPLSVSVGQIPAPHGDAQAVELADHFRDDLRSALSGPFSRNRLSVVATDDAVTDAASVPMLRARSAGARYLLQGQVRKDGNGHRAIVQVLDVTASTQLWSAELAFKSDTETAESAREAAQRLAAQVIRFIFESEARRVLPLPVEQLSAVELTVRAGVVWDSDPTLSGIDQALVLVDRALALDRNLMSGLGMKFWLLASRYEEESAPDHERYVRDLDALSARMLAIDSSDPYAWNMRAQALLMAGLWVSSMEASDKLMRIDSGSVFGLVEKANVLLFLGRPTEALQVLDTESVRSRQGAASEVLTCHARLLLGQPTGAVEACERAAGRDPRFRTAHLCLAAARANAGDLEQARASLAMVYRTSPNLTIEQLRNYRYATNPDYQRLAEATYLAGLRKAGMPER